MTKLYKQGILIIAILCSVSVFGQRAQLKKAEKAYDQYAYIDAQAIYLKVIQDGYKSSEILEKLGNTYYFNADYKNAAKWYEELIKEYPDIPGEYYFRASQSLKSEGNYKRADELMEKFVALGGNDRVIRNFEDNKDYLSSIQNKADKYQITPVAVNTGNSDFGSAFYLDKIVFASASASDKTGKQLLHEWNNQPFLSLFVADRAEDGSLSNARKLEGDITSSLHESSAVFTKDGQTVYFTRNNVVDGKTKRDKERNVKLKIFKATKSSNDKWENVVQLPFNSDSYSVAHPTLSTDETRLYFASDMPGTLGESDLWYVDILGDDSYGVPVNLGEGINTEARETFPFISEKNILYFSTDGRAGLGGLDIFYTQLNDLGQPTTILALGEPINSGKDDFAFVIKEEENLGYLSSNRGSSAGSEGDDIYLVQRFCEITISGLITDEDTGEILPGAFVSILDENNKLLNSMTVGQDAKYSFVVDCDKQYTVRATKEAYNPAEKIVSTPKETASIDLPIELKSTDPCPPNDLGCKLSLQPIYFDFDRYNIRPDAAIELAKILAAMREYPELVIHIESHTDSRGSDTYNELLSERRAQSTLEWLVSNGISRDRLSAKGYGEYRLVNECSNGVRCTEAAHQLNRRSMFIIQD